MDGKPIDGAYTLGFDTPDAAHQGWLGSYEEKLAQEKVGVFASYPDYLQAAEELYGPDRTEPDSKRIWDYSRDVDGGDFKPVGAHVPTLRQLDGDCVGAGCKHAIEERQCYEIAGQFQEERLRPVYVPWLYGVGRTHESLGNGSLGRRAGATGAWIAEAARIFGIVFADDAGIPNYTLDISQYWGFRGPPQACFELAKDNKVGKTAKLSDTGELRHELINHRPVTIASYQGWRMQPVEWNGLHIFVPSGRFAHQTVFLDWIDDFGGLAYRKNSWGPDAHGTPLNGEPPGGAWMRSDDIENEIRRFEPELYAMSLFSGSPGSAAPGIL